MSICGNCHYPYEKKIENPELTEEEICGMGCSHQDAAEREQWAYNNLYGRYKELETKHNNFVEEMKFVAEILGNK